jgi:hypothetical protein
MSIEEILEKVANELGKAEERYNATQVVIVGSASKIVFELNRLANSVEQLVAAKIGAPVIASSVPEVSVTVEPPVIVSPVPEVSVTVEPPAPADDPEPKPNYDAMDYDDIAKLCAERGIDTKKPGATKRSPKKVLIKKLEEKDAKDKANTTEIDDSPATGTPEPPATGTPEPSASEPPNPFAVVNGSPEPPNPFGEQSAPSPAVEVPEPLTKAVLQHKLKELYEYAGNDLGIISTILKAYGAGAQTIHEIPEQCYREVYVKAAERMS